MEKKDGVRARTRVRARLEYFRIPVRLATINCHGKGIEEFCSCERIYLLSNLSKSRLKVLKKVYSYLLSYLFVFFS